MVPAIAAIATIPIDVARPSNSNFNSRPKLVEETAAKSSRATLSVAATAPMMLSASSPANRSIKISAAENDNANAGGIEAQIRKWTTKAKPT